MGTGWFILMLALLAIPYAGFTVMLWKFVKFLNEFSKRKW